MAVQVMDTLMPHFALMHEMTTEHVHEEIQLLANDFSTMLMETLADTPRWSDYYWSQDQTSSYEYLRTQLQALQFLRGGRRWVLKSPQHLGQLAGARYRLPRRGRGVHPPRSGAGGAVDDRDDHLQRADAHRDRVDVARTAAGWVNRLGEVAR